MNNIEEIYLSLNKLQQQLLPYDRELNSLLLALEPTMHKIIGEISVPDENLKADLLQEGRIAIYKAIASFNQKRDVSFHTFVYTCIKNAMYSYLRTKSSKKNSFIENAVPIEQINEIEIEDPSLDLEAHFDAQERINKMLDELDETQKSIALMMLEGYTYEEMALKLNKNRKYIDNKIQQIRKIFKSK